MSSEEIFEKIKNIIIEQLQVSETAVTEEASFSFRVWSNSFRASSLITFLSEPEQHYFNYIFNNSEYDNTLDLRNRYAHGTRLPNAKENEKDYFIILRLLVLIIIKMNEEFCLYEEFYVN